MVGSTISHYRIVEKLGEGGMGVVYKAEDTKLERTVALKFLAAHLLNDEEAKQRFLREAKAAAALHHPNICPVYEIDEVDGKTFLAMAFLERRDAGRPHRQRAAAAQGRARHRPPGRRRPRSGARKGIVHRDIKPANVLVDARRPRHDHGLRPGAADRSLAPHQSRTDHGHGGLHVARAGPGHGGRPPHATSGRWAACCTRWSRARGRSRGSTIRRCCTRSSTQEPEPLTAVRAGVPMELEFIVGKCLAKDARTATGSAQEVARELRTLGEKLRSGRSTILRTTSVPASRRQRRRPARR